MSHDYILPPFAPQSLGQMPPKWAHLCLDISNFINNYLGLSLKNRRLLLGVSGGADSVSMLLIFKALQSKFNLKLEVAHLDHGLRSSSSLEAEWVAGLSRMLGLTCHVRRLELGKRERGLEEKGRQARQEFFDELRTRRNLEYIALAHNQNDLAEDQLMRMLRGCGWPELGGMPALDPKRRLLRPLLLQPRRRLEQFLSELAIGHMEDESNASDEYTRNRVGHHLIPLLEEENTGYLEHAKTLWKLAWADQDFWDSYLPAFSPVLRDGTVTIELNELYGQGEAVALRIFRQCLTQLAQLNNLPPFFTPAPQLFELFQAVQRRRNGQGSGVMRLQFPGGAEAAVERQELVFRLSNARLTKR
ncbi:MAG: tRNA lysidine(34) synthetase TilS [Desulfovibrionaceae bacterium]|nr:tRNA lysidine(34) synthetase TilS [Desulfovibrionaceae bacterium]